MLCILDDIDISFLLNQGKILHQRMYAAAVKMNGLDMRDQMRLSFLCVEESADRPLGYWCGDLFQIDTNFCVKV